MHRPHGARVVPDLLADGGVAVSYFEWVQNARNTSWEEERISAELRRRLLKAYDDGAHEAREAGVSMRLAAFMLAARRVARATELRGL